MCPEARERAEGPTGGRVDVECCMGETRVDMQGRLEP